MSNPLSSLHKIGTAGSIPRANFKLVAEKLEEWDIYQRFFELNPDVAERYKVYKTYEILKNDNGKR